MSKILITPRSLTRGGDPGLKRLEEEGFTLVFSVPGQMPDEDELVSLLPGCTGWLAGVEKISDRVLAAAVDCRVISRNGTGVDNIDLEAAEKRSIKVERAEGANARGVAELAVTLMLSLFRSVPLSDREMKKGNWTRSKGMEVEGKTLGLIGCGKIGKLTASMALGIGMNVKAFDAYPDTGFNPGKNFCFTDFKTVLASSDVVSLHCPPPSSGKPLIDEKTVSSMKEGAYLVNTARASLVEESAVESALEEGKLSGFATDVFVSEPPELSALYSHDKVIITPHIGGFTTESVSRATEEAVSNILKVLKP